MHLVSWDNAVNRDRAELIFNNRNHEYGGYVIRRDYEKIMVYALLYTIAGIALIVVVPLFLGTKSKPSIVVAKVPDGPSKWIDTKTIENPVIDRPAVIHQKARVEPTPYVVTKTVPETIEKEQPKEIAQQSGSQTGSTTIDNGTETGGSSAGPIVETIEKPVATPDVMPIFPGGERGLVEYLANHIKYPPIAKENHIEGIVYIGFVVDKEGKVTDAKVLRKIEGGCSEEALRVINSMPLWQPGKKKGELCL